MPADIGWHPDGLGYLTPGEMCACCMDGPAGAECQKERTCALHGNTQSLCEYESVVIIEPQQTSHQSPGVRGVEANLFPGLRVEQGWLGHQRIPALLVMHHDLTLSATQRRRL